MKVGVTDSRDTMYCDVCWKVSKECAYRLAIDQKHHGIPGLVTDVNIMLEEFDQTEGLGGFDLVIAYDLSALTLQSADPGNIFTECGWEYFTYRLIDNPACTASCPTGLVRIVAIANLHIPSTTPSCQSPKYVGSAPVSLASLSFVVSSAREFTCTVLPIRFYWPDCTANLLTNSTGSISFVNCHVFDPSMNAYIEDPNAPLPGYLGVPNSCFDTVSSAYGMRGVQFYNGFVDVVCADSVDSRGDINLNGIAYEIADVVVFLNYLILGPEAFGDHLLGSMAASDVNADGVLLSLPDLIYLMRVVMGDAAPFPKSTSDETAVVSTRDGKISVSGVEAGAVFMELKGEVSLATDRSDFVWFTAYDGTTTKVISVMPFQNVQEAIGFSGDLFAADHAELVRIEIADISGNAVKVEQEMPVSFALNPNYPNPFNPSTTISFDSPKGGAYKITVYNTAGQKVTELSGVASVGANKVELNLAGNSSGVYLYRLETEGFSATRKAVLLK
jgi:hypothetical protein